MSQFLISEEELINLLRNSFIAGSVFGENNLEFEMGHIDEVIEPDFGDYYSELDLSEYKTK